jgi:multidrug resistance efflux pump
MKNIDLYNTASEEVQEIMGYMPSWITRWGTTLLGTLVLLLLVLAWLTRFPDVIDIDVTISDVNPPVKIVAQGNGKIQSLFVQDKQSVEKDQMLAVIENSARTEDIIKLQRLALQLDTCIDIDKRLREVSMPSFIQAGEIQDGYAALVQAVAAYQFFISKGFHGKRIGELEAQLRDEQDLLKKLNSRDTLLARQLESEDKKVNANRELMQEKIIAPLEFEDIKKHRIDQQISSLGNETNMIENSLQQKQYAGEITNLQQEQAMQQNELVNKIRDAAKRLRALIKVWEQKYIMKSPSSGIVNFFNVWTQYQYVHVGDPIMLVTPPLHSYVVRAALPMAGAGKVRPHQKVLINLKAYPFEEFGSLKGEIKDISQSMLDSAYAVEVTLNEGLTTSRGRTIPEQPVLQGHGEIVTNDKSIFERLFESMLGKMQK